MNLKQFDQLTKHDFDNGAVIDEIRDVIKQRDALREVLKPFAALDVGNLLDTVPLCHRGTVVTVGDVRQAYAALVAADDERSE